MKRTDLKIGQQVLVMPEHTNKDAAIPEPFLMYVRELKKGPTAGLSHTPKSKHIYGIRYDIIKPFPGITKVKLEFEVMNDKFEAFSEWLQGIRQFTIKDKNRQIEMTDKTPRKKSGAKFLAHNWCFYKIKRKGHRSIFGYGAYNKHAPSICFESKTKSGLTRKINNYLK